MCIRDSLSGFSPGDVPGIGTFYDFFWHMWNSDKKHLSTQFRYKKKKTPKGKKHGDKTPNIEDTAAFRFIRFFKKHPLPDSSGSPLSLIFRLYNQQFLDISAVSYTHLLYDRNSSSQTFVCII